MVPCSKGATHPVLSTAAAPDASLEVREAVCKKRASKSAAKVPIASLRAVISGEAGLDFLVSYFDLVRAVAWWSDYLLCVEVSHLYKDNGLLAYLVRSFRHVGFAHPLLSIGNSLLLIRCGPFMVGCMCPK